MLELRPNCEHCDCDLPPQSKDAMICSYECTFCRHCVHHLLDNVCPNCGGGFTQRPIRPAKPWRSGVCLQKHPAGNTRVHKPVDVANHRLFAATIKDLSPELR